MHEASRHEGGSSVHLTVQKLHASAGIYLSRLALFMLNYSLSDKASACQAELLQTKSLFFGLLAAHSTFNTVYSLIIVFWHYAVLSLILYRKGYCLILNHQLVLFLLFHTISPLFLRFVTLTPGDVFLTGTPPGVGVFRKPPVFLKVMVHDTNKRADVVLTSQLQSTGVTRCTFNTLDMFARS